MKKIFIVTIFLSVIVISYANAQTLTSTQSIKIPILVYHSVRPYYPGITNLVKEYTVPPDIFDEQLKYLQNNSFMPITIDDLLNYLTFGKTLPQKPFIITLDDGWENQFRYAFPILKKYNDPAEFYIYSDVIDRKVFMTWNEVKTLINANMAIGSHTKSHPQLPKITDENMLKQEIIDSKKIIEDKISKTVDSFAYPYGAHNDHDVELVMQAGYKSARGVHECSQLQSKETLFNLCGIIITGDFNKFVSLVNK